MTQIISDSFDVFPVVWPKRCRVFQWLKKDLGGAKGQEVYSLGH